MKKNILLLITSITICLLICEFILRYALPQINDHDQMFQFEQSLGWEFIPNNKGTIVYQGGINHTIQINDAGFRDISFKKKKGKSKIMVVGDSFVSNISVEEAAVFTQVIEDQLEDTSVYNFGVNGYGQVQEYLLLKKWVPIIQPDTIIAIIYLRNDFTDNVNTSSWLHPRPSVVFDQNNAMEIIPPSKELEKKKVLPIYYRSHLFRLVKKSVSNIKIKASFNKEVDAEFLPPELHTCQSPFSEDTKKLYNHMQKLLLEINVLGKDFNIPVIFALAPSMAQVEDDLWTEVEQYLPSNSLQRDLPNQILLAFAKANQLEIIDLMPALRKATLGGLDMYNIKEQHWTVEGNKVVADEIANYLLEKM